MAMLTKKTKQKPHYHPFCRKQNRPRSAPGMMKHTWPTSRPRRGKVNPS